MAERRFRLELGPAWRWSLTAVTLIALIWWLDTERLVAELTRFSLLAVALALLVSVVQVVLSAWRWRLAAQCLGLSLALGTAVREYYLATFLNQCLPGGVLGDVNRAWRHGKGSGEQQAALHGVMIERLSGQLVLLAVAMSAGVWLAVRYPDLRALGGAWHGGTGFAMALAAGLALALALMLAGKLKQRVRAYLAILGRDLYRGLLAPRVLPLQLLSSLLVVASYLGVFWLLASSAQDNVTLAQTLTLLALCSLLLLAMVIPLTVAGWGVREGAAAILWPLAGLPAEQGVALSVGYGLTFLLSSLPGSLLVFTRPLADR